MGRRLIALVYPGAMADEVDRLIDAAVPDDAATMTESEQQAELAWLDTEIYALQRVEEALIEAAFSQNVDILKKAERLAGRRFGRSVGEPCRCAKARAEAEVARAVARWREGGGIGFFARGYAGGGAGFMQALERTRREGRFSSPSGGPAFNGLRRGRSLRRTKSSTGASPPRRRRGGQLLPRLRTRRVHCPPLGRPGGPRVLIGLTEPQN